MTELVLVVITIGVLVSAGVPLYQNVMKDARQKSAKLNLNLVKDAQEIYYDEHSHAYFPSIAGTFGVASINTNLKLNITEDILNYTCAYNGGTNYDCRATFPKTGIAEWYCQVTKNLSEAQCF